MLLVRLRPGRSQLALCLLSMLDDRFRRGNRTPLRILFHVMDHHHLTHGFSFKQTREPRPDTHAYDEDRQRDPLLIDLWGRVTTVGDPEMDAIKTADYLARPAEVVLRTADGRVFTHRMVYPPGSPKNPLSGEELDEKFMFWSTLVISDEQARRLKSAVEGLDAMDDVNDLGELLRVGQRTTPSDQAHGP